MENHRPTFTIESDDPLGARAHLRDFLLANGYEAIDESPLTLIRGKKGASWFRSDMSRLHTHLSIEEAARGLTLSYCVEVRGQRLTEDDKRFWHREVDHARAYLLEPDQSPRDLRPEEALRAERLTEDLRRQGIFAAIVVFLTIFAGVIVADRLGLPLPF